MDRREKRNSPMDFLYFVALKSQATEKNLEHRGLSLAKYAFFLLPSSFPPVTTPAVTLGSALFDEPRKVEQPEMRKG